MDNIIIDGNACVLKYFKCSDPTNQIVFFFDNTLLKSYFDNKRHRDSWQYKIVEENKFDLVTVIPKSMHWYLNESIHNNIDSLGQILKIGNYKKIVLIGSKMGCVPAINFSKILLATHVILLDPIISLANKYIKHDTKYKRAQKLIRWNLPRNNLEYAINTNSNFFLVYDPCSTFSISNRNTLKSYVHFNEIKACLLSNGIYKYLIENELILSLINNICNSDYKSHSYFESRKISPIYWENLLNKINANCKENQISNLENKQKSISNEIKEHYLSNISRELKFKTEKAQENNNVKIFCIGFHKTGTTSMNQALSQLGYKVKSNFGVMDVEIKDKALLYALELTQSYDAFEDMPWPLLYKELDKTFPNAKFILTLRDEKSWYNSVLKYFSSKITETRKWIYGDDKGSPVNNKTVYINRYRKHNKEVLEHFEGKDNLLIYKLVDGQGWEPLCKFLDIGIPSTPFPHRNKNK